MRKHHYTKNLGWPEPNHSARPKETFLVFMIENQTFNGTYEEFDFSIGCINVIVFKFTGYFHIFNRNKRTSIVV